VKGLLKIFTNHWDTLDTELSGDKYEDMETQPMLSL